MKIFHCSHCQHLVFFENTLCVYCGHQLAYSPTRCEMLAVSGPDDQPSTGNPAIRLCRNYTEHKTCNWALEPGDDEELCLACRLTTVIPDLSHTESVAHWHSAETAKRRLIVNLLSLGLPVAESSPGADDAMRFEFKEPTVEEPVLTGHHEGTITLNVSETNDVERERIRATFGEPYRTVLGHLRHESGHYYWDRLIRDSDRMDRFSAIFGDASVNYADALEHHYTTGPRADWQGEFISAYASMHPWEDWAETWAHYLHMSDTLETARACGLTLKPRRNDEPVLQAPAKGEDSMHGSFEALVQSWFPVTYLLNNLNRGLGLSDAYPFVLTPHVIEKLRFVHDTIREQNTHLDEPTMRRAA